MATGAPQQTVVAIWHVGDLAEAIAYLVVVLIAVVITLTWELSARSAEDEADGSAVGDRVPLGDAGDHSADS